MDREIERACEWIDKHPSGAVAYRYSLFLINTIWEPCPLRHRDGSAQDIDPPEPDRRRRKAVRQVNKHPGDIFASFPGGCSLLILSMPVV
ncbi:MAG: hypothetical protein K6E30_04425 [Lachnospiraceae bacterium]|nr:hypothetical protein [Lachnospiraceae bacterium]